MTEEEKLEIKWASVKKFYEENYSVMFSKRPSSEEIDMLWRKMEKVCGEIYSHYSACPSLVARYNRSRVLASTSKR